MTPVHEWLASAASWWPRLADHLWQATIFGLVVLVLSLALKRGPARSRHTLWLLASAKFIVPASLLVFISQLIGADSLWPSLTNAGAESSAVVLGITEPASLLANTYELTVTAIPLGHNELYCALTGIWLIGFAALFLSRTMRRAKVRQALKQGRTVTAGREWSALKRAQDSLNLSAEVRLVISSMQMEPGVVGVWKPAILLPESIAEHLDDDELEAIMLHELVHVQRQDNLTGKLQLALTAVFWFNPLVWFISRKLFDEREQACDEKVLEIYGAPETYATSILKVVRFSFGWKAAGVTGAGSGSNLRRRIDNIMSTGNKERKTGIVSRLLTVTALGITLIVLVVAAGHNRARSAGSAPFKANDQAFVANDESIDSLSNPDESVEKGRKSRRIPQTPPPPPPPAEDAQPPSPPSPVSPPSPAQPRNNEQPPAPPSPASPSSPTQPKSKAQPPQPPQPSQPPAPPAESDTQEKSEKSRQNKQDPQKGGLIEAPRPVYPEEAKKQKVEGVVAVEIVIGEDGNVVSARPRSGPELLQGAARDAAMKARFNPSLVNGKPAKVSGTMSYRFVLDEKEKS